MPHYVVEVQVIGRMTIMQAKNIQQARKIAHEEYGRLCTVTKATPQDIAWYNAMSGKDIKSC